MSKNKKNLNLIAGGAPRTLSSIASSMPPSSAVDQVIIEIDTVSYTHLTLPTILRV